MTPSTLEKIEETNLSKGGLLLLKLYPKTGRNLTDQVDSTTSFSYDKYDGQSETFSCNYAFQPKNEEYFSSEVIKKGVSIYIGMKMLRGILKAAEKLNKSSTTKDLEERAKNTLEFLKRIGSEELYTSYESEISGLLKQVKKKIEGFIKLEEEKAKAKELGKDFDYY